jgi:hypothetical protein
MPRQLWTDNLCLALAIIYKLKGRVGDSLFPGVVSPCVFPSVCSVSPAPRIQTPVFTCSLTVAGVRGEPSPQSRCVLHLAPAEDSGVETGDGSVATGRLAAAGAVCALDQYPAHHAEGMHCGPFVIPVML